MSNETETTTEEEFVQLLREAVEAGSDELSEAVSNAGTFEEDGLLTSNTGLVVRMEDGSEFQLTVVRSR